MFSIPLFALAFAFGIVWVQRSDALMSREPLLYSAIALGFLAFVLVKSAVKNSLATQHVSYPPAITPAITVNGIMHRIRCRIQSSLRFGLCILFACGLGFVWASFNAQMRMQNALPKALEQVPITLEGVVLAPPKMTQYGWRVLMDVQTVHAPNAAQIAFQRGHFPKRVSLNYYPTRPITAAHSPRNNAVSEDVHDNKNPLMVAEQWRLTARLKKLHSTINPHGFDFEAWAMSEKLDATGTIKTKQGMTKVKDFVWQPRYIVESLRDDIQRYMTKVLGTKPHFGLVLALVVGEQAQISQPDWQVMLITGTTHLMSISGLHISLMAGFIYSIFHMAWRRLPSLALRVPARKAATLAAVLAAMSYALIAGFAIPTQRALAMLLVLAIALWTGRQFVISQVLALALIFVLIIDPLAVVAAGFWLSFGAVACLAFAFSGRLANANWWRTFLRSQWAITLGLLPVLLVLFNQVSFVSPIANAVAIPLISFVVAPLALLGGFFQIDLLLEISHFFMQQGMLCLIWLSQQPMTMWQQHAPPAWTLLPAMLGAVWLLLPKGFPLKWMGLVGFLPLFTISPAVPKLGEMRVTVLDVSQGLSVLVETHTRTLLYDTGNAYNRQNDAGKSVIVPFLRAKGIKRLDGVLVSHADTDHSGGLKSVLAALPVAWLGTSFDPAPFIDDLEPPPTTFNCLAGQTWSWDQVTFEVLYPMASIYSQAIYSDNDRSCVLKITSQFGSILLTGDIEKNAEALLINDSHGRAKLKSDVLIVPHHGSRTSSGIGFIQAVSPSTAIFTVGYLNRYRHPNPEVLNRYLQQEISIYRSDYAGGLTLDFNQSPHIHIAEARNTQRRYWHQSFKP